MGKSKKREKLARESGADEKFASTWSPSDPAFAAWWFGTDADSSQELVTPYTVLGLSAVLRAVSIISTTIAALPLKTYERQGDERVRIPSVFDDPYPGLDGMTPFAWNETVLIHLLLWRQAFLWHEARDIRTGAVTVYRPIVPDLIQRVHKVNGKYEFTFLDVRNQGLPTEIRESQTVGSESITYIAGPSLDGFSGNPLLHSARAIFSGALSGDKAAQTTLRRGIRLAGLLTPEGDEEIEEGEGKAILDQLRQRVVGREHSGDVAFINKRVRLQPWTPNNIESQWAETRNTVLGEVGRLFGIPPHLLNDIEKQTSWGTGVAEQNIGLARYTLMGWTSRIEQVLARTLPPEQFVEYDYKGLFQGTPAEEVALVVQQLDAGLIDLAYACKVLNLPAPTAAQKARRAVPTQIPPQPTPQQLISQEKTA